MFGQRANHNDDKAGAPAIPPVGTLNTSNGIPDDQAVSQMLADTSAPSLIPPAPAPVNSFMPFTGEPLAPAPTPQQPMAPPVHTPPPAASMPTIMSAPSDDLIRMKQEALQHLQPLVGTLQQNPEEEFRTLMMMIQATDDKSMLQKALEAAKRIGDDKVRAQAMLDVINEINYFTQVGDQ